MSPNHHAFVAVTVHFIHKESPLLIILDIVEVAKSHTGMNLAMAFAKVVKNFSLCDKMSNCLTLCEQITTNIP